MLNSLSCPFEGDDFMNLKCMICKISPNDVNYLADGVVCSRCINDPYKKEAIVYMTRYITFDEPIETVLAYTKEIENYING